MNRRERRRARGVGLRPEKAGFVGNAYCLSARSPQPAARSPFIGILALTALIALAGCSSSLFESDTPVPTSYVLAPAPAAANPGVAAAVDLSIGRPDVAPGLDTERIAVLRGRQLDYYRGVKWGVRAPDLLQTLLVDSLQDQHLFRSVAAEHSHVASDYLLDLSVRQFQAEYAQDGERPIVQVAITGRLIRIVNRELVHTVVAQAQRRAADNRMSEVAAAFEAAVHEVALDLARKTAAAVVADDQNLRTARGESN